VIVSPGSIRSPLLTRGPKRARTTEWHDHPHAERIIEVARQWARAQKNILAVALVASYARKTAKPASDIDLVMLTYEPTSFRTETTWCHAIDWAAVNARPLKCKDEDYGPLWSRCLLLDYNGGEIEFGFVSPAWADVHPVDSGTRRVVADRCRVLHDPRGLRKRLCAAVDRRVERPRGWLPGFVNRL
jgi:Nucleotidyltransferase domain